MENKEIKVSGVYLFYDFIKHKLVATTIVNYPGMPFMVTPCPKTPSERLHIKCIQQIIYIT